VADKRGQFKKGGGRVGSKKKRRSSARRTVRRVARKTVVPIGIIAGMLPGVARTARFLQTQGPESAANEFMAIFSGYDTKTREFSVGNMKDGLFPLLAGIALHRVVGGMLGVNRMLAASRIPLLRI